MKFRRTTKLTLKETEVSWWKVCFQELEGKDKHDEHEFHHGAPWFLGCFMMTSFLSLFPSPSFFSFLQFSLVFSITVPTFPFFSLLCISIKGRGDRDQIANIHWIIKKAREFQKNMYFDYAKAFDYVDHNKLWKILKEMGIPEYLTCLLRNLYAGQKAS